ncbi:hypothetical protein ACNRBH_10910 [Ralstonia pseudosolanacearum]|uniref:hypothetical protein n=1 Tax=Ralstonia pseudosolanacearum TaxID=1310165 RepID=UPI000B3B9E60|nr:hypothetical protein [Ralstonia pseudosolanacearum]ARU23569.1 hypothetical protein RSSE_c3185 [Ralstonia solanacearum]MDO3530117.1 hypothetical protein [Ralstonia pseudosolanacearum]
MAFLWKDAINRMTTEQRQAEFDALCWEWWARTRDTDTCKPDWDALFAMLHPLYVWWREEDHVRFVAWQQRKAEEHSGAQATHDEYHKEHPMHPALAALEKWQQPASEFQLSDRLSAVRGRMAALEPVASELA